MNYLDEGNNKTQRKKGMSEREMKPLKVDRRGWKLFFEALIPQAQEEEEEVHV